MSLEKIKVFFYALNLFFFLVIFAMFFPGFQDLFRFSVMLFIIIYSFLGLVLSIIVFKSKIKGKLKKYLLVTGISSFGVLFFSVLHNIFYALQILLKNIAFLSMLMGFLHSLFFIIAILACPVLYIIGVVGTLITLKKQ